MIDLSLHPRQQSTVLGHRPAWLRVQAAMINDRMPHAWLVSGQRGIGKATLTYSLIKELLSGGHPDPEVVAHQINAGTYPNLLALEVGEGAREITADQGRRVSHFLSQSPAQPGWRAVVIDAADEMNRFAANSLLKSLEEPPSKVVFFLITHSLGLVLPTLRSRCTLLNVKPLRPEELGDVAPELQPLLDLTGGSLGRAQALQNAGGLDLLNRLLDALDAALKQQWMAVQAFPGSFTKNDPALTPALNLFEEILRRLVHASQEPPESRIASLAQRRSVEHWITAYEKVGVILPQCQGSHLDQNHLVMALFMIVENPALAKEWARKPE